MQNSTFLVATGIRVFRLDSETSRAALEALKQKIRNRHPGDPEIGESLRTALAAGQLNFVVMDAKRTHLLCGELRGQFQSRVTRELADKLRISIPDGLYFQTR